MKDDDDDNNNNNENEMMETEEMETETLNDTTTSISTKTKWHGIQNFASLQSILTQDDNGISNHSKHTLGLFVVCGSWNHPTKHMERMKTLLLEIVSFYETKTTTSYFNIGILQVDGNDDDIDNDNNIDIDGMSLCLGDDNGATNTTTTNFEMSNWKFPIPPEKLPALLFLGKRSTNRNTTTTTTTTTKVRPDIRYLQSITSESILRYCRKNLSTSSLLSSSRIDMKAIQNEVQTRLLYLGLLLRPDSQFQSMTTTTTTTNDNNGRSGSSKNNNNTIISPETFSKIFGNNNNNKTEASSSSASSAIRIFIAGDRMSVGKTSVCLGLLGSLIQSGYFEPSSVAYIKPATQNESPQLVQRYCENLGIDCIPIGPIVYYRGFTRAYLKGETETSQQLLQHVEDTVDQLSQSKRVVIVDGVGFPAVGSICGTDNASVAKASGYPILENHQKEEDEDEHQHQHERRYPPGVIIVGGSGVGGAVDAFNLNATYFESMNIPVLGAIFNKLSLDGFYSLQNCKEQISLYFDTNLHQQQLQRRPFGFVPLDDKGLGKAAGAATKKTNKSNNNDNTMDVLLEAANEYIRLFSQHVDMNAILEAAYQVQQRTFPLPRIMTIMDGDSTTATNKKKNHETTTTISSTSPPPLPKRLKTTLDSESTTTTTNASSTTTINVRSRAEIEQAAIQAGAAPSA